MTVKLNPEAVKHAEKLIMDGDYRINTMWSREQPTDQQEKGFLDKAGRETYALWYLGVDPDEPAESRDHYKFPYGDFKSVHRSGLIAAKQRAAQNDYADVEAAADDLLDMFDRMTAC